jgi:hypothetical protein
MECESASVLPLVEHLEDKTLVLRHQWIVIPFVLVRSLQKVVFASSVWISQLISQMRGWID